MKKILYVVLPLAIILLGWWYLTPQEKRADEQQGQDKQSMMSFFITSINPGKGGDLGGLSGADSYCQSLASTVGAGNKTWRAYLSASATTETPAINARDRIGNGPWVNFNGVVVANNIDELRSSNNITKQTALTEKGEFVNGRGDTPNWHDILTGSQSDGTAFATSTDTTCGNWTKSAGGSAMVGHHDRIGLRDDAPSKSWNASHFTRGCSLAELATTGSGGLIYCFAIE